MRSHCIKEMYFTSKTCKNSLFSIRSTLLPNIAISAINTTKIVQYPLSKLCCDICPHFTRRI
uniref:Uncharacterized protein n=1 Tax=Arundo donax TaxID=35708 RepID=A0A0A8Z650_ARUDO